MPITAAQQTDAYRFFAIAFGAAPGVEYMNQIAAAYEGGASTKQIVNAFVSKSEFTSVYPIFFTSEQFATKLVNNVVGSYATAAAKAEAVDQIVAALNGGATRGDVVFAIFNNLAAKPFTDPQWGAVSQLLNNQVQVAKYYTETLLVNTTDAAALRGAISRVTPTTDVSTEAAIKAVVSNDAPVTAATGTASGNEEAAITFTVAATDPNGDTLTYTAGTAANGTVTGGGATGAFTYTPKKDFVGTDTVVVTVTDAKGATTKQTVTVTVANVNDAPTVTAAQAVSGSEDAAVSFTVTGADVDTGDALTYTAGKAANGTVTGGADGKFTYTPNANFNGTDTVVVTVTDKAGATATQTVTITVAAVNDAPTVTASQSVSVTEDVAAAFTVSGSDVDTGDTLTYTAGKAANGTISGGTDGKFTYTPNANFNGTDTAVITVTDKAGASVTQTVTFTVAATNDAPTLAAIAAVKTNEDTAVSITAVGSDVDTGDTLTYAVSGAKNGTVTGGAADGKFTYTPNKDFNGAETLTVTVTDKAGATATQTVTVSVAAVNDAPVVVADAAASVVVGTTITLDVTANDTDVDGDAIKLTGTPSATYGTVSIVGGKLQYVAPVNYSGADSITYSITDGSVVVAATQAVTVLAPSVAAVAASVNEGGTAQFTVTGAPNTNYGIVLGGTATLGTDYTASGSIQTVTTGADGKATLSIATTRDKTTEGAETITASVVGFAGSTTVTVADTSVNNVAPVFTSSSSATTAEDKAATITLTATDANAEDTVTFGVASATNGTATISNGVVTFTPAADFNGTATVTVTATDGTATTTGAISVVVTPVNDAPTVTAAQTVALSEDATATFTVTGATDIDGDTLTYTAGAASKGTVTKVTGSTFTYVPNADANGTDSVVVTVSDGNGGSATQTVTFNIAAVNDAPKFPSSSVGLGVRENTTAVITAASATDVDDATLTYTISGDDADLFQVGETTGVLSFKAAPNFEAPGSKAGTNTYSVTLTATDAGGLSSSVNITVPVQDANDAPTFTTSAATLTVAENSTTVGNAAASDVDAGDALTYSISGADAALFNVNATTGALSFKTAPNFEAPGSAATSNAYSVTVTATDKAGATATQALTINVDNRNDAPTAVADTASTQPGRATTINVLANDTDPDTVDTDSISKTLSISSVTQPNSGGGVVISGNQLVYTSAVGYTGTETFTYTVTDGKGGFHSGSVTVTVAASLGATAAADEIYGTKTAEAIDGLGGADTIIGGGGLDTLAGGDGNDRVTFSDAADLINGGAGTDTLVVNGDATNASFHLGNTDNQATDSASRNSLGNRVIIRNFENLDATNAPGSVAVTGSVAVDTSSIITGSSNDNVTITSGGASTVSISTNGGADTVNVSAFSSSTSFIIDGGAGADTLTGGAGADSISGGDDADSLVGGDGNDTILGGAGNDRIDVGNGVNSVDGGAGSDIIIGGTGADTLAGGDDADSISGASGADVITGGLGDDTIIGGESADNLSGGDGNDLFRFASAAEFTEDATVAGGVGTDTVSFADNASALTITDSSFSTADTSLEVMVATSLGDAITLGTMGIAAGLQTLTLGDGNDVVTLGAGSQMTVNGGAGTDSITVTTASGYILSVEGVESISFTGGATANETVNVTAPAAITLSIDLGNGATDRVNISGTADVVLNATAVEAIYSGSGSDTINLAATDNSAYVDAGAGNDTVTTATGADTVIAGEGNDSVIAGVGNDSVSGGNGADTLEGGSGADTLLGDSGNDVIISGQGVLGDTQADVIDGGAGADTFLYLSRDDMTRDATIIGGEGSDTLAFTLDSNGQSLLDADFAKVIGVEVLSLGSGADTVTINTIGAASVTTILLGTEDDLATVGGANVAVTINGGDNTDTVSFAAGGATVTVVDVEAVTNSGATAADTLVISQGSIATISSINLGAGNDSVTIGASTTALTISSIDLGNGSDMITISATAGVTLSSVLGVETIAGGAGIDRITIDANNTAAVSISGGAGADTITGGTLGDTISGGTGADSIMAGLGNDVVNGDESADYLEGGSGADTILGGAGDDVIVSGEAALGDTSADSIDGGEGADTFRFLDAGDMTSDAAIIGGAGTDTIAFTLDSNAQTLLDAGFAAISGVEVLNMHSGADVVTFNTVAFASGIRTVELGADNDLMTVGGANVAITVNGGAGSDTVSFAAGGASVTIVDVETVTHAGASVTSNDTLTIGQGSVTIASVDLGNGDDRVTIDGTSAVTVTQFNGGDGTDSITIMNTAGVTITSRQFESITGSLGADSITIDGSNTVGVSISALTGNDTITIVAGGAYTVDGGLGTDTLVLASGTTATVTVANVESITATADASIDVLTFSAAAASGTFVTGFESVTLTSDADVLQYGITAPNDQSTLSATILGGAGNDQITIQISDNSQTGTTSLQVFGGLGDDLITVTGSLNVGPGELDTVFVIGGSGKDTISLGGHTQANSIDVVRINLGADLASGTNVTLADVVTGFGVTSGTDYLDLASFTLRTSNGADVALTTMTAVNGSGRDDFTSGARERTGTAASFSDMGATNGDALVFVVTDGGTASFTTQTAIDAAVTLITSNMGSVGVAPANGQKVIIIVQSTGGGTPSNAVFLYQEAGDARIQSSELTLIGVVNGKALTGADLG